MPALLDRASAVATTHYDLLRVELGSEVMGVWLIGSAILGDLTVRSDVDTLTLTARPLETADTPALERVHHQLLQEFPDLAYDTTYLSVATLSEPAVPGLITPFSVDGRLHVGEPAGEVHPVTWLTLPEALPAAGIDPGRVNVAADRAAAEAYTRGNLQTYWASVAEGLRLQLSGRHPDEELEGSATLQWVVLGAPRLAAFLSGMRTTGPIPSKSEAGRWVIDALPRHADLAKRALQARGGARVRFTVADALEAVDLVSTIVHGHG